MAFSPNLASGLSAEINVTPLIDVLLVLLIIFMVVVPLAPMGMDTAIPSPANSPIAVEPPDSAILIQLDGETSNPAYRINGIAVNRQALDGHLRKLMASRVQRQLVIQADARLDFGAVSAMVDAGRQAGAVTVGLITPAMVR